MDYFIKNVDQDLTPYRLANDTFPPIIVKGDGYYAGRHVVFKEHRRAYIGEALVSKLELLNLYIYAHYTQKIPFDPDVLLDALSLKLDLTKDLGLWYLLYSCSLSDLAKLIEGLLIGIGSDKDILEECQRYYKGLVEESPKDNPLVLRKKLIDFYLDIVNEQLKQHPNDVFTQLRKARLESTELMEYSLDQFIDSLVDLQAYYDKGSFNGTVRKAYYSDIIKLIWLELEA